MVGPMFKILSLLLPALIPSWRFFDEIAPSPRIEFALLPGVNTTAENWQEFRPRPESISLTGMLKRLIWNASWNESLFLVSCAERLMANPTEHSKQEIFERIARDIRHSNSALTDAHCLQFRLKFINRNDAGLQEHVVFVSEPYTITRGAKQ